ncbi:MAG: hypothetical protein NC429_03205 [Lachnospiraceae bacterium]|nr:hypothetical protein [Lachnospiraceae bacterium]
MKEQVINQGITIESKWKMTMGEFFYCLYFAILLTAKGIGLIEGQALFHIAILSACGCFAVKMLLTRYTVKEFIIVIALGLLFLTAFLRSGEKGILFAGMTILGLKNVDIKKVFKMGFVIWCCTFFGIVLIHLFGISNDLIFAHKKLGLGYILRYSLGFPHPNVLQISYVTFMAFFLYLWRPKTKRQWAVMGLLFLGNCYFFLYSISYTGIILATVYLAGYCYFTIRKSFSKLEKILIQMILPACALFSILGPVLMKGKLFDIFNKILNTRFKLSNYFLTNQPLTLLGSALVKAPEHYGIDCSYVNCLLLYGIVLFVLLMTGYFFLVRQCVMQEKRRELAMLTGFFIAGISEPFLFNSSFKNLTLLFLGGYFYELLEREEKTVPVSAWELFLLSGERAFQYAQRMLRYIRNIPGKIWRRAGLAGAGLSVVIALVYACQAKVPSAIYMPVSLSDTTGEEPIYIDPDALPEDFDGWMPQAYDADTQMYQFTGNIIVMEQVRGVISSFLISFGFIYGAEMIIYALVVQRKRENVK